MKLLLSLSFVACWLAVVSQVPCVQNSWYNSASNKCYRYNFDVVCVRWYALRYVRKTGERLPCIHSAFEQAFIEEHAKQHNFFRNSDVWLGLKKDDDGVWKWEDGIESDYRHWANGEPVYGCAVLSVSTGAWLTAKCDDDLRAFFTEYDAPTSYQPGQSFCFGSGVLDSYGSKDKCLYSFGDREEYKIQYGDCGSFDFSMLSIENAAEGLFIQSLTVNRFSFFNADQWIGLYDNSKEFWWNKNTTTSTRQWVWADNSTSTYRNWDDGYPADDADGCVAMRADTGKWYNSECDCPTSDCGSDKYTVCEMPAVVL